MARRMVESGGVFIQSESEIAAINMVLGASAAGARAMTSSSGPGMSLKQEGISYLVADELPAVIVNMVRGGPGMGNISPSQSDYFQATRGGGHGDYHTIVLAPASVQELTEVVPLAFELADKYRNPVLILGDGMLGQMMEPVDFDSLKRPADVDKPYILTGPRTGRRSTSTRSSSMRSCRKSTTGSCSAQTPVDRTERGPLRDLSHRGRRDGAGGLRHGGPYREGGHQAAPRGRAEGGSAATGHPVAVPDKGLAGHECQTVKTSSCSR
jgi:hypothetical protein